MLHRTLSPLALLLALTTFAAHTSCSAGAVRHAGEPRAADRLIGTWDVVAMHAHWADGRVTEPFGTRPVGRMVYDADGKMIGLMMHERRDYAGGGPVPPEVEPFVLGYFGDYTVDESQGVVIHRVTASVRPTETGALERRYVFRGDDLELSADTIRDGMAVRYVVVWRRAR